MFEWLSGSTSTSRTTRNSRTARGRNSRTTARARNTRGRLVTRPLVKRSPGRSTARNMLPELLKRNVAVKRRGQPIVILV